MYVVTRCPACGYVRIVSAESPPPATRGGAAAGPVPGADHPPDGDGAEPVPPSPGREAEEVRTCHRCGQEYAARRGDEQTAETRDAARTLRSEVVRRHQGYADGGADLTAGGGAADPPTTGASGDGAGGGTASGVGGAGGTGGGGGGGATAAVGGAVEAVREAIESLDAPDAEAVVAEAAGGGVTEAEARRALGRLQSSGLVIEVGGSYRRV